MGTKRGVSPVNRMFAWVRKRSMMVKIAMGITVSFLGLLVLRFTITNQDHFFVASESVHFVGILILIHKLIKQKTCSGLSLKTQELTAIFLAVRLMCSALLEADIHTVLDFSTLVSTVWVIYMIRFKLKTSYMADMDDLPHYYLLVPAAVLAFLVHPDVEYPLVARIFWAFCVYMESVAVLPQLRMMQKAKIIEPFTGHYVFALGISRFFGFAHWIFQVYETRGGYLFLIGAGYIWLPMVLLAEIVQTFILADFCYYYIKSVMSGHLLVSLPLPV
ncbi:membrane trafficking regulatory protein [Lithospermum erythrorhizon]|uniref:Membrane trafficking regulatory protein n=1 Tax=Lithospermum erythrorhizon TaxID=34254 RepID=A0AAV3PL39_LITER